MADTRLRILSPEDSIQRWKPNVTYISGQQVLSPSGYIVAANNYHVSGSSFDATLWTIVLTGAFLPLPKQTDPVGGVPTIQPDGSIAWQVPS